MSCALNCLANVHPLIILFRAGGCVNPTYLLTASKYTRTVWCLLVNTQYLVFIPKKLVKLCPLAQQLPNTTEDWQLKNVIGNVCLKAQKPSLLQRDYSSYKFQVWKASKPWKKAGLCQWHYSRKYTITLAQTQYDRVVLSLLSLVQQGHQMLFIKLAVETAVSILTSSL